MKRAFNIGDIAHLSKGKRVRGILNHNTDEETYTDFTLRFKSEVKIIGYNEANEEACGGWIYDYEAEHKGIIYRIECITQFDLIPKEMWKKNVEQEKRIKELQNI